MHQFDPNENPYVDDLLRLLASGRGRFSRAQIRALAHVYISRLYGVDTGGFLEGVRTQSDEPVRCSVRVLLDGDVLSIPQAVRWMELKQRYESAPDRTRLVVVHASTEGVTELFSGRRRELAPYLRDLAVALRRDSYVFLPTLIRDAAMSGAQALADDEGGRVLPLDGAAARNAYWRDDGDEDTGAWEHHGYDLPPADTGDGSGRDGSGGGSGRGGDGEGPPGGDDRGGPGAGRGGVMEVLDHPVLFSADPQLLADILEDL